MEMRWAARQQARQAATGLLLGLAALAAPPAWGLDCDSRWLSRTEMLICADPRLLHMQEQVSRRIKGSATRLSFGQYLGLRHWQASQARQRDVCKADRECIVASLRAQARFLDRLQRCAATGPGRRGCLRSLLADERASMRR
jgi:uncharacterized protein